VERDVERRIAVEIWEQMEHFAHYCFNKSHTTAYAMVTYETAYLKANYPVEFMAALMTCDMGVTDKIVRYMGECRKMGIEVRPPDVNVSLAEFTVEDGVIRFGLGAVKGVGISAIHSIERAREESGAFRSLFDFCERVDLRLVNRAAIEALVKSGCFDSMAPNRAQLMEGVAAAVRLGNRAQQDRDACQLGLFGGEPEEEQAPTEGLPDVPAWPEPQVLAFEKETLGFYVTSHPLAAHEEVIRAFSSASTATLKELEDGRKMTLGGMFSEVRETFPRSGRNRDRKMAIVRLEDFEGDVGGVIFSEPYAKCGEHVEVDRIVFVEGTVDRTREEPSLKIDRVIPIERAFQELARSVTIRLPESAASAVLQALKELLESHRGRCPVYVEVAPLPTVRTIWRLPATNSVLATPRFVEEVEGLVGAGCVTFSSSERPSRNGEGLSLG
jgi:DNA polymerase-3 subunit alpha